MQSLSPFARRLLQTWTRNAVSKLDSQSLTDTQALDQLLPSENVVALFVHPDRYDGFVHAAFFLNHLKNLRYFQAAFAGHLFTATNDHGDWTIPAYLRTASTRAFSNNTNSSRLHLSPVVRPFELKNPKIFDIVRQILPGTNRRFWNQAKNTALLPPDSLVPNATRPGFLLHLAASAGISFKDRPHLHHHLYDKLNLLQQATSPLRVCFVGAFLQNPKSFLAQHFPLFAQYQLVVRLSELLPENYPEALELTNKNFAAILNSADWELPPLPKHLQYTQP